MDEAMEGIDIAGKRLAYSSKDLYKLRSTEGCSLRMVAQDVIDMDDDDDINVDEEILEDCEEVHFCKQDKIERSRREYLILLTNANRDAIKPGSKVSEYSETTTNEKHLLVHKMYENMGSYEERLANKELGYQEISPGRVYKRVVNHGTGPAISENVMVIYNCALWTEKRKEPFDSTWLRHTTIINNLSTDSLLPGLHELLLTCRMGEWCEAFFRPEVAFGRLGVMPRIAPNATIFCLLEVVKVITQDKMPIYAMEAKFENFYEAADDARKRGNHFFDNGQYRPALQRYKSGIRILDALTYKNETEEKAGLSLLVKLYNNCARAANASGNPRLALAACKHASLIDDRVPKTYWHRMAAWNKKGHYDRALGVARRAMQLFQNPKDIHEIFRLEADKLKAKMAAEQARLDEMYRVMGRAGGA